MAKRKTTRSQPLLGAHTSIAGGTPLAVDRAASIGATAMQIFVKNNNRWEGKRISEEEADEFCRRVSCSKLRAVGAHASYLINLASPERLLWERSLKAMRDELERCRRLGVSPLVVHPGAHLGKGETWGVVRVAQALNRLADACGDSGVRIALEATAGQGTALGWRFAHLRDILAGCAQPRHVQICLDTCHLFAAGYDFRSEQGYREMLEEFDRLIGLHKISLIHMNDSKRELGSRVDRHEHIGKGQIGPSGFAWIMRDERFRSIPKILETPKGKELKEDRRNLRILRKLMREVAASGP